MIFTLIILKEYMHVFDIKIQTYFAVSNLNRGSRRELASIVRWLNLVLHSMVRDQILVL